MNNTGKPYVQGQVKHGFGDRGSLGTRKTIILIKGNIP